MLLFMLYFTGLLCMFMAIQFKKKQKTKQSTDEQ